MPTFFEVLGKGKPRAQIPGHEDIHTFEQFVTLVTRVQALVNSGELQQVAGKSATATDQAIADFDLSGVLPDHVEWYFVAPGSSTMYKLAVNIYHGRGGAWTMLDSSSAP